ncbi:MAG: hypothetical protein ACRCW0_07975 [Clostridium sp.]
MEEFENIIESALNAPLILLGISLPIYDDYHICSINSILKRTSKKASVEKLKYKKLS